MTERTDPMHAGPFFDVPAGTPPAECRSCRATIYWIVTPGGDKRMPVDCEVPGGMDPDPREHGTGVSHFATCPQADQWRSRGTRSRAVQAVPPQAAVPTEEPATMHELMARQGFQPVDALTLRNIIQRAPYHQPVQVTIAARAVFAHRDDVTRWGL